MRKSDARVLMTKRFLKESLVNLLYEKGISEVSIKEVCENAQINRATFYSHYKSIDALYEEINVDFMNKIFEFIMESDSASNRETKIEAFEKMISYIDRESKLFTLLFCHTESRINKNKESKYKEMETLLFKGIPEKSFFSIYKEYVINFYVYAGGSILNTWIDNGKKESPHKLASIMVQFLFDGIPTGLPN